MNTSPGSAPSIITPSSEGLRDRIGLYTRYLNEAFEVGGEEGYNEARAILGRTDLFYLLVYILNRKDMLHPWLFERTNEVQAHPDGYLDLWAREHYKSTIGTFGLNIQEIIKNPEVTICIFSHTRTIAKGFLQQIKTELETNRELKFLYPDIFWQDPQKQAKRWSMDGGIEVKRQKVQREATVEAWGVIDSQPVSKHFDILDYDDLVAEETVSTPEQAKKCILKWANSLNIGRRGGRVRYKGTRWAVADPYREIVERGAAIERRYPVTANGKPDGVPVFLTPEENAKKRSDQGPYIYGCQMLLDPRADETLGFKEEWLRYWPAEHMSNLAKVIIVDPASKKKATSDYTAMWVIGYGADENWYVGDMIYDKLNLPERIRTIFRLHRENKPLAVFWEEYGLQADIEAIKMEQENKNYRFDIHPVGGSLKKEDRILRLQPKFEQQKIYLPERCVKLNWEKRQVDLVRTFVRDEYLAFPVGGHDDGLDSLSRICDDVVKNLIDANIPDESAIEAEKEAERQARLLDHYDVHGNDTSPTSWMGV